MHLQCNICNSCVTLQLPCSHSYCAVRGSSPIALQSILIPAMECWVQILGCNEIEMVFFSNHVLLRFKNLEAYFWFVLVALLACVGLFATLPRTDSEFVVSGADLFLGRFLIKEGNQKRHRLTGFRIDGSYFSMKDLLYWQNPQLIWQGLFDEVCSLVGLRVLIPSQNLWED